MEKILIIGAGPAGATAAYELSKSKNTDCKLIEISNEVGGMARSITLFNQTVDIGPHRFFSNDSRVNKLWLEVVGKEYRMVDRTTRIFYKGSFFHYPLKPLNALYNLGFFETIRCLFSYMQVKISPRPNNDTFEDWVTNRFGARLYRIFFKGYTEKLWGIPCDQLTSEFAQQRIKKFSLGEAIRSAFSIGKSKHKTLVDQFAYPLEGNGYTYKRMVTLFQENGGKLVKNTSLQMIRSNADQSISVRYADGTEETFDKLISTMPIDVFLRCFENTPDTVRNSLNFLKFRYTIIAFIKLKKENMFIDQWLYIQESDIKSGRVTNFNNWVPEIRNEQPGTTLALEYWCFEEDDIWKQSTEHLRKIAVNDLIQCKFIKSEDEVIDFEVVRVPKCYPIYNNNYKEHLDTIIDFLSAFKNIQLIGRYGSYKYNNQDHSILMGYLAARNILYNENNNLWDINTDYEYHESSTITATGLSQS